jgi:hypothetical protein
MNLLSFLLFVVSDLSGSLVAQGLEKKFMLEKLLARSVHNSCPPSRCCQRSGNAYHLVAGHYVVGPLGGNHVGDALMLVQLGR